MCTYSIGHIDTPLAVINSHNLHTIQFQTLKATFEYNLYSNETFICNCKKLPLHATNAPNKSHTSSHNNLINFSKHSPRRNLRKKSEEV